MRDFGGNKVRAEFEFGSSTIVRDVDMTETRYPWQARVITPAYAWKDASGEHTIFAAVLSVADDGQSVTLYDIRNHRELTVASEKLGSVEQRRIAMLQRSANTRAQGLPSPVRFEDASAVTGDFESTPHLGSVFADPPAVPVAVPMGGAGFAKLRDRETVVGVFPIGASQGWILGATRPESYSDENYPARLVWATLRDGKVVHQHAIHPSQTAIAVHPGSQLVMTVGQDENDDQTLTIFRSSPKQSVAKPLIRFFSGKRRTFDRSWGGFIDGRRVLHRSGDGEYTAYDLGERRAVYKVLQQSFFDAEPMFSPGHRFLAMPEDNGVRVLRSADGATLAQLPVEGNRAAGVAFDAAGQKLAVLSQNELAVWTLGSSAEPARYRADGVGSSSARSLAWVDDRSLLIGGSALFDLEKSLVVWKYVPAGGDVITSRFGQNPVSVEGGRLSYAVSTGHGAESAFVIGAVEMPGPKVREIVAAVDPESLYVIRPGESIALSVQCGGHSSAVQSALEQMIVGNGWRIDPSAPLEMVATMGRYPMQTQTYREMGGTREVTVSSQPFFSRLEVRQSDDLVVWSSSTSSGGLAPMMWVREGESPQAEARKYEKPNPEFFSQLEVPAKLFDARFRDGFGTSTYGKTGLEAKVLPGLSGVPRLED